MKITITKFYCEKKSPGSGGNHSGNFYSKVKSFGNGGGSHSSGAK